MPIKGLEVLKIKIIVVSGGFDPIHSGHIEYFKAAKKLGDHLIVALNSDCLLYTSPSPRDRG